VTFFVPAVHVDLYSKVESRFRLLLTKNVVTGITEIQFNKWLSNFITDEDQYLAARLLENLTFRSEAMVASAIAHVLQCILPCELRRLGFSLSSVDDFVESIGKIDASYPIRFIEINDPKGVQPGKSGSVIMRELHRLGGVSKRLMCLPQNLDSLPASVQCLVFIDDMLGTGTQFASFAAANELKELSSNRKLLYCPLAAYKDGLQTLAVKCPWLKIVPVEVFDQQHCFFRGEKIRKNIWAIDHNNEIDAVRQHMKSLCDRAGISQKAGPFGLDLLIGFHHATPNNTLKIMYADTPTWHNLLTR
jgi:hypothetical protein